MNFHYLDADPYIPNGYGAQWYTNQDNLYDTFASTAAF